MKPNKNIYGDIEISNKLLSIRIWNRTKTFLLTISFFLSFSGFTQIISTQCELDGSIFAQGCTKYQGDCENTKANGWGGLYFNDGDIISGLFKDNKIQNFYIKFYRSKKNDFDIGPNKGINLHGPCISISNNSFVSLSNFENGKWRGNGTDYFQISKPNFLPDSVFVDPYGYGAKDRQKCNLIPKTNYIIYTSTAEYNSQGDHKYWISVVDLTSNKIIRKFGSFEKPITFDKAPNLEGFDKDNNPIYSTYSEKNMKYGEKYFSLNISNGIIQQIKKLPSEIEYSNFFIKNINSQFFKDFGSQQSNYHILTDSSYVKSFNSKSFVESLQGFQPQYGSGSGLVRYDKTHKIINSLELKNANIFDFSVDEFSNRIALGYKSNDSTFISYFDLNTFELISHVLKQVGGLPGELKFSKTGTYLFYKVRNGTIIYLGNSLYFGFPGELYDTNDNDNVIISNDKGMIYAYDLEKKTIVWAYKIGDDYINTKFFNIDNNLYIISGRPLSWSGFKVKENGLKLYSFASPKPIFSLKEFVKNPEEIISKVVSKKEVDKPIMDNTNSLQQVNGQTKKTEDELFSNFVALLFLSAYFESSNNHQNFINTPTSENSNQRSSDNYSQSSSNNNNKKPCNFCNKTFDKKYYYEDGPGCYLWKTNKETKPGYVVCKDCYGCGFFTTRLDCPPRDRTCWCFERVCKACENQSGWMRCSDCYGTGTR